MGIPKGEVEGILDKDNFRPLPPLVVGRVRETYETFPGGSLHTFSPVRKYDRPPRNDSMSLFADRPGGRSLQKPGREVSLPGSSYLFSPIKNSANVPGPE